MREIGGRVLRALGAQANYNGIPAWVIIDKDVEVETEGGAFITQTLAHVSSAVIPSMERGDVISIGDAFYEVESLQSNDGEISVLVVRSV